MKHVQQYAAITPSIASHLGQRTSPKSIPRARSRVRFRFASRCHRGGFPTCSFSCEQYRCRLTSHQHGLSIQHALSEASIYRACAETNRDNVYTLALIIVTLWNHAIHSRKYHVLSFCWYRLCKHFWVPLVGRGPHNLGKSKPYFESSRCIFWLIRIYSTTLWMSKGACWQSSCFSLRLYLCWVLKLRRCFLTLLFLFRLIRSQCLQRSWTSS